MTTKTKSAIKLKLVSGAPLTAAEVKGLKLKRFKNSCGACRFNALISLDLREASRKVKHEC